MHHQASVRLSASVILVIIGLLNGLWLDATCSQLPKVFITQMDTDVLAPCSIHFLNLSITMSLWLQFGLFIASNDACSIQSWGPSHWSNSKFYQNLKCSSLKCTLPITTKFCTCDNSVTVSVIGGAYFKLERFKFWSNFEFDQISLAGQAPALLWVVPKRINMVKPWFRKRLIIMIRISHFGSTKQLFFGKPSGRKKKVMALIVRRSMRRGYK